MEWKTTPAAAKAQLALAILVAHADGVAEAVETTVIAQRLERRLAGVGQDEQKQVMAETLRGVEQEGLEIVLTRLAADLATPIARHQALRLAIDVAHADGRLDSAETSRVLRI